MLSVTRVLNGTAGPGDGVRYGRLTAKMPPHLLDLSADMKPVVVWDLVRRRNGFCMQRYGDAGDRRYPGELPVFSGGEPLTWPDQFGPAACAFTGDCAGPDPSCIYDPAKGG